MSARSQRLFWKKKIDSFLCLCAHCDKGVLTKWRQSYTKRIFFKNNGLDIDKNHKQAIEQFKESMSNGDIHTHLLMEGMEFLVELSFQEINKNSILIVVRNHGEMNASEIKNVNFMIDRGRKTNEVSDLLSDETSNKEGGGLGLSMIVILMKKLGLTPDCLYYEVKDSFTSFNVRIPYTI